MNKVQSKWRVSRNSWSLSKSLWMFYDFWVSPSMCSWTVNVETIHLQKNIPNYKNEVNFSRKWRDFVLNLPRCKISWSVLITTHAYFFVTSWNRVLEVMKCKEKFAPPPMCNFSQHHTAYTYPVSTKNCDLNPLKRCLGKPSWKSNAKYLRIWMITDIHVSNIWKMIDSDSNKIQTI